MLRYLTAAAMLLLCLAALDGCRSRAAAADAERAATEASARADVHAAEADSLAALAAEARAEAASAREQTARQRAAVEVSAERYASLRGAYEAQRGRMARVDARDVQPSDAAATLGACDAALSACDALAADLVRLGAAERQRAEASEREADAARGALRARTDEASELRAAAQQWERAQRAASMPTVGVGVGVLASRAGVGPALSLRYHDVTVTAGPVVDVYGVVSPAGALVWRLR